MPGNPLVRFDEGRVGRTARCRPLSYSTGLARKGSLNRADRLAKEEDSLVQVLRWTD